MLFWLFLSIFSTPVSVRQRTSRAKIYYPMGDEAVCTDPPQYPRGENTPTHEFVMCNKTPAGSMAHVVFNKYYLYHVAS